MGNRTVHSAMIMLKCIEQNDIDMMFVSEFNISKANYAHTVLL